MHGRIGRVGWMLGRSYWRFLYTTLTCNGASADGTAESDREAELRVVCLPPSNDIIYVLRRMLYFMFHSCGIVFLSGNYCMPHAAR